MLDELLTRSASIQPATFDPQALTVSCIWSTGAPVLRRDSRGAYTEVLSLDPAHVQLTRLTGASVLNAHRQDGLDRVLGIVQRAWLKGGAGHATIRLSARPDLTPLIRDIQDGVIRHVSIGYSVRAWRDTTDAKGGRVRTAVNWEPQELSLVPVSADPGAMIRSRSPSMSEAETVTIEAPEPVTENRAEVNQQIRSAVRAAGLPAEFANGLTDRSLSLLEARAAAFEEMQRTGTVITTHRAQVGPSNDDPAVLRTRMAEALACRMDPSQTPSDAARAFMGLSLSDMARTLLTARGERVSTLGREEILTRAMHTVSDFPELLSAAGNRVLLPAYQAAASPLKQIARQRLLNDFRPASLLKLGGFEKLKPVTEAGEIKAMTTGESREGYALETFGGIFNLSRKAIINDDTSAFGRWADMMGRAAAETEADQLAQLLLQGGGFGPVMGDGKRLFHSDHGNFEIVVGGVSGVDALSFARQAMRMQTGLDGKTAINVVPKFLLVSADLETRAEQLLATLTAGSVEAQNPFSGKLVLLVESRLPADSWYVFADPAQMPVIEYAYLSSAQGPQTAQREGWEVLAREFRCVLDFGCGLVDWRGVYRSQGASL